MGYALSRDLRERIIRGIASGKSCRAMAAQFEVAPSTAIKLQQRFERTGTFKPARRGRARNTGKLGPHRDWLIAEVEARPDITMPDLAAKLEAAHGVRVDPSNISKLLCREGYSYKKNTAGIRARSR